MGIQQFCRQDVVTIDREATARDAARAMRDQHVGALAVTAGEPPRRSVVGLVTDRDLVLNALADHAAPAHAPVAELMSHRVVAVPGSASVADVAAAMHEEGVRRILVMSAEGRLVGIVSLDDLVELLSAEMAHVAKAVRAGIVHERSGVPPRVADAVTDEPLTLPQDALALRWRQISSP